MPQPKERAVPFQEEDISFDINFLTFEDEEYPLTLLTSWPYFQMLFTSASRVCLSWRRIFFQEPKACKLHSMNMGIVCLFQLFLQLEDRCHLLLEASCAEKPKKVLVSCLQKFQQLLWVQIPGCQAPRELRMSWSSCRDEKFSCVAMSCVLGLSSGFRL